MTKLAAVATVAILAGSASAHTIFQKLYVNGVDQGELTGIRAPDYDGPIQDVTSNDIICNGGINPYHTPISTAVIDVPAGATVTAEWHHTLNQTPNDPADPIDSSHKGPVISYLAKIPDATQSDVTGLKWFKIQQDGYTPSTNTWAVDRLIQNKGKVSFTIPSCIESGQYLLRHEIIALHAASNYPGAQFYMECAQINVTGGSGSKTPATVSFPGAYQGTDPGIKINIYQTLSNYTIPGPAVFTC
ncbi:glycoside hydrolase family 61 protein [Daedaleopsis nitida]|nr:glycoside hydrolase family 61 protein [Daedaleopsis nitida]